MALVDLKTNLKNLRYSKDTLGGGWSGQPFVQSSINSVPGNGGGLDVINRGGTLLISKTAQDAERMTKLLLTPTTFQGPFFTLKQKYLLQQNVTTQASSLSTYYSPLRTIEQVVGDAVGLHKSLYTNQQEYVNIVKKDQSNLDNRLYLLTQYKYTTNPPTINNKYDYTGLTTVLKYSGGPGLVNGQGDSTIIRMAADNTLSTVDAINYPTYVMKMKDLLTIDQHRGLYENNGTINIANQPDYTQVYNLNVPKELQLKKSVVQSGRRVTTYGLDTKLPDPINLYPVYTGSTVEASAQQGDLIPFYFKLLKSNTEAQYVHFRAFLEGISDSYTGEWSDFRYMGRAEKFYTYQGFDRQFSFGFSVHAYSYQELKVMYKKLNMLAASLAPTYNNTGIMRGNFAAVTIGSYLSEQVGIIKNVSYTPDDNAPWNTIPNNNYGDSQEAGDFLPHLIKVQVEFIPIQTFVPQAVPTNGTGVAENFINLGTTGQGY